MKSAGVLKSKCDFKGGTLICLLVYVVFTYKATEVGSAAGCCAKDSESLWICVSLQWRRGRRCNLDCCLLIQLRFLHSIPFMIWGKSQLRFLEDIVECATSWILLCMVEIYCQKKGHCGLEWFRDIKVLFSPCNPQFKMLPPHCNDVTGDRKQFVMIHKWFIHH